MKKFNKKILISIFVFFIVLLLSISIIIANNTNNEVSSENKEKIYYEIKYLDNEIIIMYNLINNNSAFIDWQELQINTAKLYNYWNSTILDLNTLSLDKNYLTDFGKILDNLTISIKNKDKQGALTNLAQLYKKLTIYAESLDYDVNYTNILYAKYNLLVAYSIVEKGNWTLTYENIVKSTIYLSNVVNSMENNKYNQYNINQAYVAVKEMENLINIKDLDVFYIKYNIAMQKLQNI